MNTFEDYDMTLLGEPVQAAALAQSGFRKGVLALTETRLVFLRQKKSETYIDRESRRTAIADVTYTKSWGSWHLEYKDRGNPVSYMQANEGVNTFDLEPFVEPLRRSAEADTSTRKENELASGFYDGHDITKVGESGLLVAKASGGWRSGVLVLTETRLVYLRKKKNETIIDRVTNRSDITDFRPDPMSGNTALRFNDEGSYLLYTDHGDDLDPFVGPLQASSDANKLMHEAEQREAKKRTREKIAQREETKKERLAELETLVGEPVLLSRTVVEGLLVLTEQRLLLLDTQSEDSVVVRETDISAIENMKFSKFSGVLEFKVGNKMIIYSKKHSDLKPIVDALQHSIDANAGIIHAADGSNGQVYLYEDRVSITRKGFGAKMTSMARREKDIMLRDISSVELRKSGVLNPGFIRFGHSGGPEPRRAIGLVPFDAISNDTNAVTFNSEQQERFEILRSKIEKQRSDINLIQAISPSQTTVSSPMDELKKLAELKAMGIVTEDEFEQKKKQLLGL